MENKKNNEFDQILSLCVRRAMIVPSSTIYGNFAGFYDFIGYGAQLKRNIENYWWKYFVESREDMVGLDGALITPSAVWKASGHLENFNDPLVECTKCKNKFRADSLIEEQAKVAVDGANSAKLCELIETHNVTCPNCGGKLVMLQKFNLMFKLNVGAQFNEESVAYLRGETAQSIFINFKNASSASRKQPPFGIAQVGKAFRNEISPRNFVFRMREFSQMEIEYFIHPQKLNECQLLNEELENEKIQFLTNEMQVNLKETRTYTIKEALEKNVIKTKWHAYWLATAHKFLKTLSISPSKLRAREHLSTELSHYSKETWDIEYEYPWGYKELLGIANRTDFDLSNHSKHSGKELSVYDEINKTKYIPYVIEPSFGLERLIFAVLLEAYFENKPEEKEKAEGSTVVLKLPPIISPMQVAIFPLMKKDNLPITAREVYFQLNKKFRCEYDESGSIGKRYARNDEIGTAYCITIDYQTLEDKTVTIRNRDTKEQKRVKIKELERKLEESIKE